MQIGVQLPTGGSTERHRVVAFTFGSQCVEPGGSSVRSLMASPGRWRSHEKPAQPTGARRPRVVPMIKRANPRCANA